jgi:hypothetical protein
MFDLTVIPRNGRWVLLDEEEGELASFDTQAEALTAAEDFARVDQEPRHVLIQDDWGDWDETVLEPPPLH